MPGVVDRAKAREIHLAPNEKKENLVIKLGPRVGLRDVRVRVQWPDGRPSGSTNVSADVNGRIAELAKTDATGSLELQLLEGIEYSFSARAWTSYRILHGNQIGENWVDAEKRILAAGSGSADILLVLDRPQPKR